jgi:hypothetical protein
MSDLQLLFLVLAALYGWECAAWLRRGSVAFTTWLGRAWRMNHPGLLLGNQRGGFVFAAPLPPLGTLLTANQFPLSFSPEAVLAFVATNVNPGWRPPQSGRWLALDAVHEAKAEGKKVAVNGEVWLVAPSASYARFVAGRVLQLAKLKPVEREKAIRDGATASFDPGTVEKRWQEFREQARRLRWLSNAIVLYVFGFVPALIWFVGLRLSWLGLLVGLLALMVATAIEFRRGHRTLYPDAEEERFTHTLTIALSPANAMRALDALSRPLLEAFHPLAVAKAFLSPADFQNLARRVLLDLRQPALPDCPSDTASARGAEAFWRSALRESSEGLLKYSGIEPDELCRPPKPAEAACLAYCPRCHAQFTAAAGRCADCGGLARVGFPAAG